jgi:hypothetical protein
MDFHDGPPFAIVLGVTCRSQGACYCFDIIPEPLIWRVEVMARILDLDE